MFTFFTKFRIYFAAFFIPFFLLGFVFILLKVYPFGAHSLLMADQFTQYLPFYHHLYDVAKGDGNLFYSWESGMGLNFWGTFAYYLSSPISILIFLLPQTHLPEAFILMTLTKTGLAGLTMCSYLIKIEGRQNLNALMFSSMYALMSFTIGYFFNIMWLDSLYVLPLVLLGIDQLFKKRYWLFIVSLSLLFISNFYMAYIVGLFAFLYFIAKILLQDTITIQSILVDCMNFILCTVVAFGISAFIIIPTYLQLNTNEYQPFDWNSLFLIDVRFFELLAKPFNSGVHLLDRPNIYSGLFTLLLFPLFFISKKIKVKEKMIYFILLLGLILSFQIHGLNIIWHAFESPTGYLHRFGFVFSFLVIYLAFRVLMIFDSEELPSLYKVSFSAICILILLTEFEPEQMSIMKAIVNALFLILFCFLLYLRESKLTYRAIATWMILLAILMDISLNAYQQVKTLNSYPGYSYSRNEYNISTPGFHEAIKKLGEKDSTFYRLNSSIRMTANDSLRYQYKGMNNFNTLSNGTLHDFMYHLGYSTTLGVRSLAQNNGILASDALLGFKYALSEQKVNKHGYTKELCVMNSCIYKNKDALPIGFMMEAEQFKLQRKEEAAFVNQNLFLGGTKDYFKKLAPEKTIYHNLSVKKEGQMLYVKKNNPNDEGYIEMTFPISGEQQLYTLLSAGKGFAGFGETNIYVNGKSIGIYPNAHYERVLDLGAFSDEISKVKIEFLVPETQLTHRLFYGLDIPSFQKRMKEMREQAFQVTDYSDTTMKGTITAKTDNMLFFSIPYDRGWNAKVNGEKVPVEKLGGFLGLKLENGTHDVELKFIPEGLVLGSMISIISLLSFLTWLFMTKSKNNRQNKAVARETE
ncbi:YfhO family protein [Niallia endozanthoxylica]|nr:YfhO family protein [Niallia endozanthoxylica]